MSRTGIMLCYPFEEKRLKTWQKPWIIQPKLDGDRCRALIDGSGNVTLLSSEENVISHVPHINLELQQTGLRNVELDGELYRHGMPHQDIHSIVSRKQNMHENFLEVHYHVFDVVSSMQQADRTIWLLEQLEPRLADSPSVRIVQYDTVTDIQDIFSFAENQEEMGYEGFIIRNAYAPYVRKRSVNMMKFKPRKDDYYMIVGFSVEVDKNDNIKHGVLGRLICKSDKGDAIIFGEVPPHTKLPPGYFGVGTGSLFTDEKRKQLWEERFSLPGLKLLHVKYQHLTKDKVPRFPVAVEILDPSKGGAV